MYSDVYRILLVGEPGVGKTEFIEKCIQKHSTDYDVESDYIGELKGFQIDGGSLFEAREKERISSQFIKFMMDHAFMFEKSTNVGGIPSEAQLPCVRFFECGGCNLLEYESGELRDYIRENFDKVIVMVDYTCISTMRSAFIWIDKMGLNRDNTIICVTKCDLEVEACEARFDRKARVLATYADILPVECISSKGEFNLDFFYKYCSRGTNASRAVALCPTPPSFV